MRHQDPALARALFCSHSNRDPIPLTFHHLKAFALLDRRDHFVLNFDLCRIGDDLDVICIGQVDPRECRNKHSDRSLLDVHGTFPSMTGVEVILLTVFLAT